MGNFKSTGTVAALFFILMFDTLKGQVVTESVANIGNSFLHQQRLSGFEANASSQHSTNQKEDLSKSKDISASGPVSCFSPHSYGELNVDTIIIDADFDTQYTYATNRTTQLLFIYNYTEHINQTTAVRVSVSSQYSNISDEFPVMFVARQQEGILSWRVPLEIGEGFSHNDVSRTLCPIDKKHRKQIKEYQLIYIGVSTMARENQSFNITVRQLNDFEINHDQKKSFNVSASRPKYFKYNFPEGVESVLLKVSSPSHACMTVSVQKIECPVFDLLTNVKFEGKYQTMSTQAAMFLKRSDYKEMGGFYVIFITKPSNKDCEGYLKMTEFIPPSTYPDMLKPVTVEIKKSITSDQRDNAMWAAGGVFSAFYGIFIIGILFTCCDEKKQWGKISKIKKKCGLPRRLDELTDSERDDLSHPVCENTLSVSDMARSSDPLLNSDATSEDVAPNRTNRASSSNNGAIGGNDNATSEDVAVNRTNRASSSNYGAIGGNDTGQESGVLPDSANSNIQVVGTQASFFVSDLAKKKRSELTKIYRQYHINLITIAIFYGLPAAQLVVMYHSMMMETGNEDLCYYNFMCAHPWGPYLSSSNNVFSNIGYVLLGILFILIVGARDWLHQKVVARHGDLEEKYGIPQYFGLYYAMGLALVMEGIMSGCYHVCPNYSNFQFDTSFMYIISCLCILKIYQFRHPDITFKAHKVYLLMAGIIFIVVLGVVFVNKSLEAASSEYATAAWILYFIAHILLSMGLTAHVYVMGKWKRQSDKFSNRQSFRKYLKPEHPIRFSLLLVFTLINWGVALYGAIGQPTDIATFVLGLFAAILLLYFVFYINMKWLDFYDVNSFKLMSKCARVKEFLKLWMGDVCMTLFCCCTCMNRKVRWLLVFVIVTSIGTWGFALYFFSQDLTRWEQTPAVSREGNKECILMEFYDAHDVWHFLSAISLFLSFLTLLLIDDDLAQKRREEIPVF